MLLFQIVTCCKGSLLQKNKCNGKKYIITDIMREDFGLAIHLPSGIDVPLNELYIYIYREDFIYLRCC